MKALLDFLGKVLTLVACALFLFSALLPFLTVPYFSITEENAYSVTYWSYMSTITYTTLGLARKNENVIFTNYWFAQRKPHSPPTPSELGVSSVLVTMFLAQLLTLTAGLVSLFLKKWIVQVIPAISSLSVILLMIYALVHAQKDNMGISNCELGYWLTLPFMFLYLIAFILRLESARRTVLHQQ